MPQSNPQQAATLIVPAAHCEQLYQTQATSYLGQALGTFSCLPTSKRTNPAGLETWNGARDPWLLDRLLEEQELRCLLWVDPQLEYFVGHFPGQPILPGVVQLDWAIAIAAQQWPAAMAQTKFTGVQNLKFKLPIEPSVLLQLVLTQQPGKIDFTFATPSDVRSQGTLLYRV